VAALAAGLPGAAAATTYTITDRGGQLHQLLTPDLRKVLR
jgi:hypothetical protein